MLTTAQLANFVTQAELRAALRATTTFDAATLLAPHLSQAAERFLIPVLGDPFFTAIVMGTETNADVVTLARQSLVAFTAAAYADTGTLNLTSTGIQEYTADNQKPVRLEVLENYQRAQADAGHAKLERLLAYLETSVEANGTLFTSWQDSPGFTRRLEFPISGVDEFSGYANIHNSRRVFLLLRPAMRRAMNLYIDSALDALPSGLTTPQQEKIKELTKPAFAHLTLGLGLPELAVSLAPYDTALVFDNTGANKTRGYKAPPTAQLDGLSQQYLSQGLTYLDRLQVHVAALQPAPPAPDTNDEPFPNDPLSHVYYV